MADPGAAVRIHGLKTCDTCREASRALGVAMRDLRRMPLDTAEIERFLAAFGTALINRRSTTWRGLDAAEREAAPRDLLARYPALMKRPVIEQGDRLYLGWGTDVRAALTGATG